MKIDFKLLADQKQELVNLVMGNKLNQKESDAVDGIVNLLDAIQDQQERDLKTFIVVHEHRHGASTYQVSCNKDITTHINEENPPSDQEQQIIDSLEIDLELSRDESISIEEVQHERQFIF